jgi:hypothetical protein
MTAVLAQPLFVDRPAEPGDRVHCAPAHGFPFIATVIGPACYGGGHLQVQRTDNLDYVHVAPGSVRVFAEVTS